MDVLFNGKGTLFWISLQCYTSMYSRRATGILELVFETLDQLLLKHVNSTYKYICKYWSRCCKSAWSLAPASDVKVIFQCHFNRERKRMVCFFLVVYFKKNPHWNNIKRWFLFHPQALGTHTAGRSMRTCVLLVPTLKWPIALGRLLQYSAGFRRICFSVYE